MQRAQTKSKKKGKIVDKDGIHPTENTDIQLLKKQAKYHLDDESDIYIKAKKGGLYGGYHKIF